MLPSHQPYASIANLVTYDDGNGPCLYVFGGRLQLPGMLPGQYARLARFDGHVWTPIGPIQTGTSFNAVRETSAVFDFGEGPDLYMTVDYAIGLNLAGQHPIGLTRYRGVYRDVAPVCGGDGSLRLCPCNARGAVGHGCPNSLAADGALLSADGSPVGDSLRFSATSMPPNSLCVLLQGSTYEYAATFAGDGVRCSGGKILRLIAQTSQNGSATVPQAGGLSLRALANARGDALATGSVRYYQAWYREPNPAFCTSGGLFNLTNGVRVVW
ncbi:MAG: hypothetical protein NTY35_03100 [Planctomycetota bacterium]|nr:hypothetical protein [Planctomycetota bacterium]